MALFKIHKGERFPDSGQITKATEGFAYFTTDDGKFYIDIAGDGTTDAIIRDKEHPLGNRVPLNAAQADYVKNNFILRISDGNIENNNLYTFNGSETKQLNFQADNGINFISARNSLTIEVNASEINTGILRTEFGGTGNNTYVANRLIYSETENKLNSTSNISTDGNSIHFLKDDGNYVLISNKYNDVSYTLLRDHHNGNISLSASSGSLHLGYSNTTGLYLYAGKDSNNYFKRSIFAVVGNNDTSTTPTNQVIVYGSGGGPSQPVYVDTYGKVQSITGTLNNDINGNADTATAANITSTDNAIVRFNGTAGEFQNSKALVDDSGGITLGGSYLTIKPYSSTYDTTGSHAGIRFYFNHDRSGYNADTLITSYSLQATNFYGALKGNADTATQFKDDTTVQLTGDVAGSATSKRGWTIETTIGTGKVTNAMLAGSIANNKLVNSYFKIDTNTINLGDTVTSTNLKSWLGLTNAAHYIGKATEELTDGGTENPTISGYDFANDRKSGDIVLGKDGDKEYIWGLNGWELLGPIDTIQTSTAAGTKNRMAYYSAANMISSGDSIYADASHLTINGTTIPANSGNFQVIGISTMRDIIPEEDSKYHLGNTASHWVAGYTDTFYISSDINFKYVAKNGDIAAHYEGDGIYLNKNDLRIYQADNTISARLYLNTLGTVDTAGVSMLTLGNNIVTENINNSSGTLKLYSPDQGYMSIKASTVVRNHLHYLPIYSTTTSTSSSVYYGRLVGIYKSTTVGDNDFEDVGSTSQPVYVTANGVIKAVSLKPTLNNLLSSLTEGTADALVDAGYFTSTNNNGATDDWYLRSNVAIWNYIKGKYSSTDTTLNTGPIHIRSTTGNNNALIFDRASGTYQYIQSKNPDNNISIVFAESNSDENTTYRFTKDEFYPKTNNSKNLGLSGNKWANVYATNFNGALKGNADTASQVYSTHTYPTTRSYIEYQQNQSTESGNVSLRHHNALSVSSNMDTSSTSTRWTELWIGNATASGTVGNSQGWLALYTSGTNYTQISTYGTGNNNYFNIPNYSGTGYALTSSTLTKGSATKGIYITTNGQAAEMSHELKATVEDGTANRLAYYSAAETISPAPNIQYIPTQNAELGTTKGSVNGLFIYGPAYGNTTANLGSATINVFRYGDPGPQIRFSTGLGTANAGAAESSAIIWSDHSSSIGTDQSFHFVGQGNTSHAASNVGIVTNTFIGKTRLTVGQNYANTTYTAYINGTTKSQSNLFVGTKATYNDDNAGWYLGADGTMWGTHASSGAHIYLEADDKTHYIEINPDAVTTSIKLGATVDRFTMPKLNITSTADIGGKTSSSPPLSIGTLTSTHIEIDTNEILAKDSDTTTGTLYLQDEDGLTSVSGSKGLYVRTSGQNWLPAHDNTFTSGGIRMYDTNNAGGAINWIKGANTNTNISRWWGMGTVGHAWYVVSSASSRGSTAGRDRGIFWYGNTGRFDISDDGYLTTGNLTIGGASGTDAGKTIVSSSTLYLKTSASASIIFNTNSTNRARFDPSGHFQPESTNTYTLGISGARWKSLFIGTADSYGNSEQPIYWDAGVPKATTYHLKAHIEDGSANHLAYYSAARTIDYTPNITRGATNITITGSSSAAAQYVVSNGTNQISLHQAAGGNRGIYQNAGDVVGGWLLYWPNGSKEAHIVQSNLIIDSGNLYAGVTSSTTERQVHARAVAGDIYLYSQGSASGTRGLYTPAHGNDTSGCYVIQITANNNAGFADYYNHTITKLAYSQASLADTAFTYPTVWNGYELRATTKSALRDAVEKQGIHEDYLLWGGHANGTNGWSPIDTVLNDYTRGNGFAMLPAANITIQHSTNSGSSWTTTSVSDLVKRNLVTNDQSQVRIVASGNVPNNATPQLRITIKCSGSTYFQLKKIHILIGSNGSQGCKVTIKGSLNSAPATFNQTICDNVGIAGWSGWNSITCDTTVGAGDSQIHSLQFTFTQTGVSSNYVAQGLRIYNISGYGWMKHTAPSQLAKWNHAYTIDGNGDVTFPTKLYGAVWNDYAEFRASKNDLDIEPGRVVYETGEDSLTISSERLMRGCNIISDTYGFSLGQSENTKLPIAVSGRVLAYPYEDKEEFKNHIGWPVCSGPKGTVSIMTEEEEEKYPSRIIGTISAVPDYEIWHGGADVEVNGRVWIKVR